MPGRRSLHAEASVRLIRRARRLPVLVLLLLTGFVLAALLAGPSVAHFSPRDERIVSRWLKRMARAIGLRVVVQGEPMQEAALLVANHISWLDIVALGSLSRASFLSKAEVKGWPLIGWLASRARTLFITRGDNKSSEQTLEQLVFRMRGGGQVVLFPEATTTDGTAVRRFHPRLFASAMLARVPVQPVALRYPYDGPGRPPAPFIEDITLGAHAWRLLGEKKTVVEVRFLPPMSPEVIDRRTLADMARNAIVLALSEDQSPGGDGLGIRS